MKTLHNTKYHGNKQKVGGICFDERDRLFVFVTYCPDCKGKVLFTRAEAREFTKHYNQKVNKLRTKIVIKLVK